MRDMFDDGALDKTMLQRYLYVILTVMDFMHQVGIVHSGPPPHPDRTSPSLKLDLDISPNNVLVGADNTAISKVEEAELAEPSPRKVLADRTIHLSYTMPTTFKSPVITDFGHARLGDPGQKHSGDMMPGVFRAPEVIAGLEWDSQIDMWSVGVMVSLTLALRLIVMANRINVRRSGTYLRMGICSNHSGMVISTTKYTSLRWFPSWALRPSNSWNAAIDVVSTGMPKVSTSLFDPLPS